MDLLKLQLSPAEIVARNEAIRNRVLRESTYVRSADFASISPGDIALMFRLYDTAFFGGWMGQTVVGSTGFPLRFRLSKTMTSAGGKTLATGYRKNGLLVAKNYEIAIAARMLFMNFRSDQREVTVCGLECSDRLSALMRIMEHEMIHLGELLTWRESSCRRRRFENLARNIFGHTECKHRLITPRERAAAEHGIRPGQQVEFTLDRQVLRGFVNRVNYRATVLVEDESGQLYNSGKRYLKFYVPLGALRPIK